MQTVKEIALAKTEKMLQDLPAMDIRRMKTKSAIKMVTELLCADSYDDSLIMEGVRRSADLLEKATGEMHWMNSAWGCDILSDAIADKIAENLKNAYVLSGNEMVKDLIFGDLPGDKEHNLLVWMSLVALVQAESRVWDEFEILRTVVIKKTHCDSWHR